MNLKKKLKHGSFSIVVTALFIAGVVMLNIIASLLSERFDVALDLTSGQLFSIEPETVEFLSNITDSITITVCSRESEFLSASTNAREYYNQTNEILRRFAGASSNISLRYIDLMSNPDFAAKYDRLTQGSVIIESKQTGRHKILEGDDYFNILYFDLMSGNQISEDEYQMYHSLGMGDYVHADISAGAESAFLSAVLSVTDTNPIHVGIATGHGESKNERIESLLEKNSYTIHSIDLVKNKIPAELDFIIIHAPSADFSLNVISKLAAWLDNNGEFGKNLMYIAHHNAETPNIDAFLADEWGIGVDRAYVMQSDSRYTAPVSGIDFPIQYYKPDKFGEKLNPEYRIFGEYLRHTYQVFEAWQNIETTPVLSAYDGAVLVTFEEAESGGEMPENRGEYTVGIISSKVRFEELDVFSSNVIVFGGSFIFSSMFMEMKNANNAEYFINMMNEINDKETAIIIAPKSFALPTFQVTSEQSQIIGAVFILVIPLAIIVAGVVVWIRRRHR